MNLDFAFGQLYENRLMVSVHLKPKNVSTYRICVGDADKILP